MPPPPTEVFSSRLFLGPALRAQPDRRLVTLVREGYEAAFEEIVRRYGRPLTRYAAAIVGSRSEDVTQDALSKALLALRRDDEKEIELRPWLYRIVRNTALNDLRDRPPTTEILEEAIAAGRGTAAEAEEREQLQDLIERLRALPERQRAAIVMRELEGLSHEEIAAALGLSGGAARQVIFRAREALRGGAGMLLPLPLMRMLLEHGTEATTAGAGGAAGALAAGAAGGGASAALKAGAVAAIIAGSVGTGIAIQHDHGNGEEADAAIISGGPGAKNKPGPLRRPPRPRPAPTASPATTTAGTRGAEAGQEAETTAGRAPGMDRAGRRHRAAPVRGPAAADPSARATEDQGRTDPGTVVPEAAARYRALAATTTERVAREAPGESSGPGGGEGSDDGASGSGVSGGGDGGGDHTESGDTGGTDGHSGSDDHPTTEPAPVPDGSTDGGVSGGSGGSSDGGGDLTSGSGSGSSGSSGDDSLSTPTS